MKIWPCGKISHIALAVGLVLEITVVLAIYVQKQVYNKLYAWRNVYLWNYPGWCPTTSVFLSSAAKGHEHYLFLIDMAIPNILVNAIVFSDYCSTHLQLVWYNGRQSVDCTTIIIYQDNYYTKCINRNIPITVSK